MSRHTSTSTYPNTLGRIIGQLTLASLLLSLSPTAYATVDRFAFNGEYFVAITDQSPSKSNATFWDLRTGSLVRRVNEHLEDVVSVAIDPSGRKALTSSHVPPGELNVKSRDESIRLWDLPTGKQLLHIPEATFGRFSADGKSVLGLARKADDSSSRRSFEIAAWDVQNGQLRYRVQAKFSDADPSLPFTLQSSVESAKTLFYQSDRVGVFDSQTGDDLPLTIDVPKGPNGFGFINPKGNEIQLAGFYEVAIFSLTPGAARKSVQFPNPELAKFKWSTDGNSFVRVTITGDVLIYDRSQDRILRSEKKLSDAHSIVVSPGGSWFAVNWQDRADQPVKTSFFDTKTCKVLWESHGICLGAVNETEAMVKKSDRTVTLGTKDGSLVRRTMLKALY